MCSARSQNSGVSRRVSQPRTLCGLRSEAGQYPADLGGRDGCEDGARDLLGDRPMGPGGRRVRRCAGRGSHDRHTHPVVVYLGPARAPGVLQTVRSALGEAAAPLAHRVDGDVQLARYLRVGQAVSGREHDPGPQDLADLRFRRCGQPLQRPPTGFVQGHRHRRDRSTQPLTNIHDHDHGGPLTHRAGWGPCRRTHPTRCSTTCAFA